jgi:cell wall-associated NlpC family hydrolase
VGVNGLSLTRAVLAAGMILALAIPASAVTLYSVRPKDTLARIATRHGVSTDRILKANKELSKKASLKVGQIIIIPDRDEIVVREDDETAPPVARATAAPKLPIAVTPLKPASDTLLMSSSRPLPAPTPLAAEDDPDALGDESRYENIAVVNQQIIHTPAERPQVAPRPQLASRRGRLLTQITTMARRFIGVPYVWGGTTANGYDCSGFTMRMYKLAGIPIRRLADEQYYQGKPTSAPVPGDLVFFTTYLPGPSHCGIYLGDNLFIHASSRKGITIDSLNTAYYKKRYLGARRYF